MPSESQKNEQEYLSLFEDLGFDTQWVSNPDTGRPLKLKKHQGYLDPIIYWDTDGAGFSFFSTYRYHQPKFDSSLWKRIADLKSPPRLFRITFAPLHGKELEAFKSLSRYLQH